MELAWRLHGGYAMVTDLLVDQLHELHQWLQMWLQMWLRMWLQMWLHLPRPQPQRRECGHDAKVQRRRASTCGKSARRQK